MDKSTFKRFTAKVLMPTTPDGCMEWTGAKGTTGYGNVGVAGRTIKAHRLAYLLFVGPIPSGLIVRHNCDNRLCVRPDHLEIGTYADNHRDMDERGRRARTANKGEAAGASVLKNEQVLEIRSLYAAGGITQKKISITYGVHRTTITEIVSRKTWTHI